MRGHQKHSRPIVRDPAWRPALQRLDEALERASDGSNAEKIRLLRVAMFADVDELQKSGTVKLPD